MERFFAPRSLAVIGLSEKKSNLARNIIKNCLEFGFKGTVLGVGTKPGRILNTPILASVESLPVGLDLAVVLTPAKSIPNIMRKLGERGIQRIIVETGGFGEFDPKREAVEKEILTIARHYNQRLIGPNCLGIISMESGVCTPFAPYRPNIPIGDVSIISQSGGMARSIFSILENEGVGLNKFVSVGNKLDIGEASLLEYLLRDSGTKLVFLYLEDLRGGREFLRVAASSNKPILIHKSNRGKMGSAMALSHSKALATDDYVLDAALEEAGVVRVNKTYELGKYLKAFRIPTLSGPNIMVISRSGGHAVVTADACEREGLRLPPLPAAVAGGLQNHLRANVIRLQNPLDMGDVYDYNVFLLAIEEALKQKSIHGVVFIFVYPEFVNAKEVRKLIARLEVLMKHFQKPIAAAFISSHEEQKSLRNEFEMPIFSFAEEAVEALAISYRYARLKKIKRKPSAPSQACLDRGVVRLLKNARREKRNLLLHESLHVLEGYGMPVIPYQLVRNAGEAVNFARDIGLPVVLKMVSQTISHKSEYGGVSLLLESFTKIRKTYNEMKIQMQRQEIEDQRGGLLIQKMVPSGLEVILAARRDENLGPVVIFGLGGIFTELFKDIAIGLAPLTRLHAKEMVKQVRFFPRLIRGRKTNETYLDLIEKCLLSLSDLITGNEEIVELDINPLILSGERGSIVDARIILRGRVKN